MTKLKKFGEFIKGLKSGHVVLTQAQRMEAWARQDREADLKRGYCEWCGDIITVEEPHTSCSERQ